MIDFTQLFGDQKIVFSIMFKGFAVVGSVMYLIYAIVLSRQSGIMLRALEEAHSTFIRVISALQVVLALVLIFLSLMLL